MFGIKRNKQSDSEERNAENPENPVTAEDFIKVFGYGSISSSGVTVNEDNALGVTAFWCGVNFLSSTIASLPVGVYKKTKDGREKQKGSLAKILMKAVNDEMTSYQWRKYSMDRTFTGGRSLTYIERVGGRVTNFFTLDPSKVTIKRKNNRKTYVYQPDSGKQQTYQASEIIDIPFMLDRDGLTALSPINKCKDTFGLSISATKYGSKFFSNGGVPPFVVTGNFESGQALKRASADLAKAIKEASIEKRLALTLPMNHTINPIGVDPEKSTLVDLQRFLVEEIARVLQLPPAFLQDLTHGTYSNVEQQDLNLVKHTVTRWVNQIEQELNLKIFGRNEDKLYIEFNVDGLLRGDFKSRIEGYARGIQNAIYTPSQVHAMENLPTTEEADTYLIQGATVPLGSQPNVNKNPEGENDEN